jgi:pyroglutamyl-peptidase
MRVLLTAFEPYGQWPDNSSWLALMALLRDRPATAELVTRRYPVHLQRLREALDRDLAQHFDAVLHLGQAPGASAVTLEAFAINAGSSDNPEDPATLPLVPLAPEAYRTAMPLERWRGRLTQAAIPNQVSYHAGTYLCNAVMYLSHHWHASRNLHVPVGFVHLPLSSEQVTRGNFTSPSLPLAMLAKAVSIIVEDLQTPATAGAIAPSAPLA